MVEPSRLGLLRLALLCASGTAALAACSNASSVDAGAFAELPRIPRDGDPTYWDSSSDLGMTDATASDGDAARLDVLNPDGPVPEGGDAGDASDVTVDAPPSMVQVRFGNFLSPAGASPPPALDVCLRPAGGTTMTFTGPQLAMHGRMPGVGWNEVGTWFSTTAGRYDVMLVPAMSTGCTTPLAMLPNVNLSAATNYATVLFSGVLLPADAGASPFPVTATVGTDRNPMNAPMEGPALRVFHALPSTHHFDLGIDFFMMLNVIFQDVAPGTFGGPSPGTMAAFDMYNYYNGTPTGASTLNVGLRDRTTMTQQTIMGVSVPDNGHLLAVLAVFRNAGGMVAPGVLLCTDSAPPAAGLTPCMPLTP